MQTLIDSIARVTRSRHRDTLEAAVIEVLAEQIHAKSLRLFKLVPMGNRMVVHCRVEAIGRQPLILNPLPSRSGALPPLDLFPWVVDWFQGGTATPIEYDRPEGCCYLFPISDGTTPFGWIELEQERALGESERRLIAGILNVYSNHLAVIDYAERDSLTGLMNRKTFEDAFQQKLGSLLAEAAPAAPVSAAAVVVAAADPESANCSAQAPIEAAAPADPPSHAYWLGVVDIDHFKRVNDTFGHLYGDEVLVLLARFMRESFRLADRLYRFGGEEFAVLLDQTPTIHAGEVFERFRNNVQKHEFPQIGQVTVSIGYTRIDATDTASQAFDRADAALYHAKHTGRNRVCSWDTLAQTGVLSQREENSEVELF